MVVLGLQRAAERDDAAQKAEHAWAEEDPPLLELRVLGPVGHHVRVRKHGAARHGHQRRVLRRRSRLRVRLRLLKLTLALRGSGAGGGLRTMDDGADTAGGAADVVEVHHHHTRVDRTSCRRGRGGVVGECQAAVADCGPGGGGHLQGAVEREATVDGGQRRRRRHGGRAHARVDRRRESAVRRALTPALRAARRTAAAAACGRGHAGAGAQVRRE